MSHSHVLAQMFYFLLYTLKKEEQLKHLKYEINISILPFLLQIPFFLSPKGGKPCSAVC